MVQLEQQSHSDLIGLLERHKPTTLQSSNVLPEDMSKTEKPYLLDTSMLFAATHNEP